MATMALLALTRTGCSRLVGSRSRTAPRSAVKSPMKQSVRQYRIGSAISATPMSTAGSAGPVQPRKESCLRRLAVFTADLHRPIHGWDGAYRHRRRSASSGTGDFRLKSYSIRQLSSFAADQSTWIPKPTNAATSSSAPSTPSSNGAASPPDTTNSPSPTAAESSYAPSPSGSCLLYTSDAADDLTRV